MSWQLFIRIGYVIGAIFLLPAVPMLAVLIFEGAQTNPTPAGGFGANMRLVYLLILGGPLVMIGLVIIAVTTVAWIAHALKRKRAE